MLTPLENEPDRLRSAISTCARVSKTDGSRSLDLQRDVLETACVDEVDVYHDLTPVSATTRSVSTAASAPGARAMCSSSGSSTA